MPNSANLTIRQLGLLLCLATTKLASGQAFVPMGTDKYYRLNDRLLDSELLQRLRKRGDAKVAAGDPTAIDD